MGVCDATLLDQLTIAPVDTSYLLLYILCRTTSNSSQTVHCGKEREYSRVNLEVVRRKGDPIVLSQSCVGLGEATGVCALEREFSG